MTSIYVIFDQVIESSQDVISGKTLHAIRDYYSGYLQGLNDVGVEFEDGEPPFSHFTDWLARRLGRSSQSCDGRWTRYSGGWWRLIEEAFGGGAVGFDAFVDLLTEFRQRTQVVVFESNVVREPVDADRTRKIVRLEVLRFPPEEGYYLNIVYDKGRNTVAGFYSEWNDVCRLAYSRYNVVVPDA